MWRDVLAPQPPARPVQQKMKRMRERAGVTPGTGGFKEEAVN